MEILRRSFVSSQPPSSTPDVRAYPRKYPISAAPGILQFSRNRSTCWLISSKSIRVMSKNVGDSQADIGISAEKATTNSNGRLLNKIPHVLTVAGSDSGAGAGIQADLKACGALGVYGSSVITAVTAQNTVGVQGIHLVPEDFVAEQLRSVLSDMDVDVVKTGMLPSASVVKVLCQSLREYPVQALVVDPVMVSTSGDMLAGPSILSVFREELLPMADIVTPNLKEASALLGGIQLETVADMCSAAKSIHGLGPRNVLVKGGDLPDSLDAIDIFFDGEHCYELRSPRIRTRNTHGTGCTLASCIAAELAKGFPMLPAVQAAKHFVENALDYSKDIVIGHGAQGPFDHLFKLKNAPHYSKDIIIGHGAQGPFDHLFKLKNDLHYSKEIVIRHGAQGPFDHLFKLIKNALHYCKDILFKLIKNALHYRKDIAIGNGAQGPFDHLFKLKNHIIVPHSRRHFDPSYLFLYAVTDSRMNKKWRRSIVDAVKEAIEGGATIIQLREKESKTREFMEAASACVEICQSRGVPLLINDRLDVALACDADGVHVGQSDMPVKVVRTLLGPEKIIGVSCKTAEQALQAWADGADYIGCGGVFPTTTKENNLTIGLEGLKAVCMRSKLPVVAIGGIDAGNAASIMEMGIPNLKGVAVVSALFDKESISGETHNLLEVLTNAASTKG